MVVLKLVERDRWLLPVFLQKLLHILFRLVKPGKQIMLLRARQLEVVKVEIYAVLCLVCKPILQGNTDFEVSSLYLLYFCVRLPDSNLCNLQEYLLSELLHGVVVLDFDMQQV